MNSFERVTRRLKGKLVDRPPNFNIYMTFAAHFINQTLSKYYLDYRVLVDSNMAMVDNFKVDLVQAISDPYRETHDLGAKIEFPEDGLPISRTPLIDTPDKLKSLSIPKPENGRRMLDRLEAIRLMKQKVGNEIPGMGWVEGAFAQAGDLRGITTVMMDIFERPEWLKELLEIVVKLEISFAEAQIEAGADIIGIGDALCSQLSPEMYIEFGLPYEQRIVKAIHKKGAIARLHICGDTSILLDYMVKTGCEIIDLDWMVDMEKAAAKYGDKISFCGNSDPVAVMLQGSEQDVISSTKKCMMNSGSRSISGAGCEIPDGTPADNIIGQIETLSQL